MTFGAKARALRNFSEYFKCGNFLDSPRGMLHLNFARFFSKAEV